MSELRALAEHCNFGATLDTMLRDRLVCGVNNQSIQRRLLAETDMSPANFERVAKAMEAAAQNASTLSADSRSVKTEVSEVHKLSYGQQRRQARQIGSGQATAGCYRCGARDHHAPQCKFKGAKCDACGKGGSPKKGLP